MLLRRSCLILIAGAAAAAQADNAAKRFDGSWETVVSCPNSNGALGYSFMFPAVVKDGVLHAEKGAKGEPGWLQIDGRIGADGHASLYASGLVGAAEAAVGHRPPGTQYGYHIDTEFGDKAGKGHRVEGRPCTVEFSRDNGQ
ncbi:MAG TPA: hypothetical protein VK696_10265 [Steroidobacteraceae bacterium]|jgi:hypothetical protein|nr:hypothetical protein [Steroidobacteraceae bacterium]